MLDHPLRRFGASSRSSPVRALRRRVAWSVDALEHRVLLSGTPTVYTVDALSDTGAGLGTTGDLLYAVRQADADTTNPDGSVIQFAPLLFNVPRTITLSRERSSAPGRSG
jgi:hypothetical protein